ncbi:MAG: carboxypeptidase-like regulatory domain-containing protein [Longimicrobiales bacterium]
MTTTLASARRCRLGALLVVLTVLASAPATGQAGNESVLTGRVIDAATAAPLFGAWVGIGDNDWGALTDTLGVFRLSGAPADEPLTLRVERMGYVSLTVSTSDASRTPLTIALMPKPILLERIEVIADRFRNRRNAVATAVRAFDERQLQYSAAPTALDFIESRTLLRRVSCPFSRFPDRDCAVVRGRVQPVSVYIDEVWLPSGLTFLDTYRPHELYLVEVYGGGSQVRVYTKWWLERAAERGFRPMPIIY